MSLSHLDIATGGLLPRTGLVIASHIPDEAAVQSVVRLSLELYQDGARVPFASLPGLRVYSLQPDGTQLNDLAPGSVTQYTGQDAYYRDWTPSSLGVFIVEVTGTVDSSSIFEVHTVTVRPKFDPVAEGLHGIKVSRV